MSEFHPNRQKQVKTRPGLTKRRILECWPLLIWTAVAAIAYFLYTQGHVFSRMNGAVDVYQENITPSREGRLFKILVKRGDIVAANSVVAEMDPSEFVRQLQSILHSVATDREDEMLRLDRELLDLEAELRKYEIVDAEDKEKLVEMLKAQERYQGTGSGGKTVKIGAASFTIPVEISDKLNADIAEIKGRQAAVKQNKGEVEERVKALKASIADLQAQADAARKADAKNLSEDVLSGLRDKEQEDVRELRERISYCQLRTTKGGRIDRIAKEEGEYVKAGEGVLKVVADPDEIVAFLPQDQLEFLSLGDKVWVTPAHDRSHTKIYTAEVLGISPRVNNLADATSPLPNRRIYGRDVIVSYPESAKPANPGDPFQLLPGQTVTVHIEPPGQVPWMNRLFPNEDNPE